MGVGRKLRRVLVIEPDFPWRNLLLRYFAHQQLECDWAVDGWEALHRVQQTSYDALVTELTLPRVHGYALVRYLVEKRSRPLIVVCTRVYESRLLTHLLELGVDELFAKPVLPEVVYAKIVAIWPRFAAQLPEDHQWKTKQSLVTECDASFAPSHLITLLRNGCLFNDAAPLNLCYQMPVLRGLLLELARQRYFNPGGSVLDEPTQVLEAIGARRCWQLLLGLLALRHLRTHASEWWATRCTRLGIAAALVADTLSGNDMSDELAGMLLAGLLMEAGPLVCLRVLGNRYRELVESCESTGVSLARSELEHFGITSTALVSWWLDRQGVDVPAVRLLSWLDEPPAAIEPLPAALKRGIHQLQLARALAKSIAGGWHASDELYLPPIEPALASGIAALRSVVETIQYSVSQWRWNDEPSEVPSAGRGLAASRQRIDYLPILPPEEDPLLWMLESLGWRVGLCDSRQVRNRPRAVTYVPGRSTLGSHSELSEYANKIVIWQKGHARVVELPCSIARLTDALQGGSATWPTRHSAEEADAHATHRLRDITALSVSRTS